MTKYAPRRNKDRHLVFATITAAYLRALNGGDAVGELEVLFTNYMPPHMRDTLDYLAGGRETTAKELAQHFGWKHDAQARTILAQAADLGLVACERRQDKYSWFNVYRLRKQ